MRPPDFVNAATSLGRQLQRLPPAMRRLLLHSRRATATLLLRLGAALADAPPPANGKTKMEELDSATATLVASGQDDGFHRQVVATLARVVVSLWRARRRLAPEIESSPAARMSLRHLEQAWSMIEALGITIRDDFKDREYSVGDYFLEAYSFEDHPDLTVETVIEVTSPAVFVDRSLVHKSEVIVGRPVPASTPPDDPATDPADEAPPSTTANDTPAADETPAADPEPEQGVQVEELPPPQRRPAKRPRIRAEQQPASKPAPTEPLDAETASAARVTPAPRAAVGAEPKPAARKRPAKRKRPPAASAAISDDN